MTDWTDADLTQNKTIKALALEIKVLKAEMHKHKLLSRVEILERILTAPRGSGPSMEIT